MSQENHYLNALDRAVSELQKKTGEPVYKWDIIGKALKILRREKRIHLYRYWNHMPPCEPFSLDGTLGAGLTTLVKTGQLVRTERAYYSKPFYCPGVPSLRMISSHVEMNPNVQDFMDPKLRLTLPRSRKGRESDFEEMYNGDQLTLDQIADRMNMTKGTVRNRLLSLGVRLRRRGRR